MPGTRSKDVSCGAERASRARRCLAIATLGAGVVFAASSSAQAQPPQVALYLNNYGQAPGAPPPQGGPVQVQPPTGAAGAAAAYQGEAALAQVAAYQQYLLYLSLAREGALGPSPSPSAMQQYFTNGAAVTTVPVAGPASGYYANGSEATRIPPPPPSSVPTVAASASAALPPAASALPPYFWTGAASSAASAAAPPSPPPAPSAAAAPTAAPPSPAPEPPPTQGPVMSFQEWLQSMGAQPPAEAPASAPELSAADITLPIVEPAETAYEVRPRATYELPEKAREHASPNDGSKGVAAFVVAAFAVGLLLGGLAMWRAGFRMGPPGGAASG